MTYQQLIDWVNDPNRSQADLANLSTAMGRNSQGTVNQLRTRLRAHIASFNMADQVPTAVQQVVAQPPVTPAQPQGPQVNQADLAALQARVAALQAQLQAQTAANQGGSTTPQQPLSITTTQPVPTQGQQRNWLAWILGILLVLAILFAIWLWLGRPGLPPGPLPTQPSPTAEPAKPGEPTKPPAPPAPTPTTAPAATSTPVPATAVPTTAPVPTKPATQPTIPAGTNPLAAKKYDSPQGAPYSAEWDAVVRRLWQPQLPPAKQRVNHTVAVEIPNGDWSFNGVECAMHLDSQHNGRGASNPMTVGFGNGLGFTAKSNDDRPSWGIVICRGNESSGFEVKAK